MNPAGLAAGLREIDRAGLYRRRRAAERQGGCVLAVDGQPLVDFCSNDYLGLAADSRVVAALQRGAERYGVGSGASHLVCGHSPAHHALEEELAEFVGRQRALLFSTGYMANLGVIAALARAGLVVEDRLNHASLLDGAQLAGARLKRYAHADAAACSGRLAGSHEALVVTDGVFSMDGDLAPVAQLAAVAGAAGAWLMVDDAHGLGVLGPSGGGVLELAGLGQAEVPVLVGTLGKAFGTYGAFVAGSADLIEYLIQRARTYAYTTALPPALAAATRTSLALARAEGWRRERLTALVRRFRQGAGRLGLDLMESATPIQPLRIGANEPALAASRELYRQGLLVAAIRPPTVPAGGARLRVTLNALHSDEQVDCLLEALAGLAQTIP